MKVASRVGSLKEGKWPGGDSVSLAKLSTDLGRSGGQDGGRARCKQWHVRLTA